MNIFIPGLKVCGDDGKCLAKELACLFVPDAYVDAAYTEAREFALSLFGAPAHLEASDDQLGRKAAELALAFNRKVYEDTLLRGLLDDGRDDQVGFRTLYQVEAYIVNPNACRPTGLALPPLRSGSLVIAKAQEMYALVTAWRSATSRADFDG